KKAGKVDFSGQFKGLYNDFTTTADIKSSQLGEIRGKVKVKLNKNPALSTYYGDVVTNELQLGTIIDRPDLIKNVTFDGLLDGKGLTIPSATLKLDGDIRQVYLNDYNYQNIALRGKMSQSLLEGEIEIFDQNLQAQVSGNIDFNSDLNRFDIIGTIDKSNLKALGLTKEDMRLESDFDLKVSGNTLDDWLGAATLKNIKLANDSRNLAVDSLNIYSNDRLGQREFVLNSGLFDIYFRGNYVPSQVIKDAVKLTEEYRLFFKTDEKARNAYYASLPKDTPTQNYTLNYELKLKNSEPFFAYFFPSVRVSKASYFSGSFKQGTSAEIKLNAKIDSCQIGNNRFYQNSIDLFASKVSDSPEVLSSLLVQSETQQIGEQLFTESFEVSGAWDEANLITFDTKIKQRESANDATVFGQMQILSEGLELRFNPENTQLNVLGDTWRLAENNRIFIRGDDVLFSNVALFYDKQRIAMNGIFSNSPDEVAILTANNFNLKTLQPLLNYDISGVLNGNVAVQEVYQSALINSDVKVSSFMFEKQFVGNISAETAWDNSIRKLQINAGISREEQEIVKVVGTYDPSDEKSPLNLITEVRALPVKLFQGFVNDVFSDLGGTATGKVSVKGKPALPNINGEISIDNGKLKVDVLNSYLYFTDKILVTNSSFTAPDKGITLRDAPQNGNTATLEGGVYSLGNGKYRLSVSATMPGINGFQLLNTTLADNEYFFGKAFVGGDIQLAGPFNDIEITGNLTSKRNTNLVIPLDGATSVNTETEAIPFLNSNREIVYDLSTDLIDSVATPPAINLSGVRMAFNLTLTPAAECEIIFDRTNNDKLVTRGNGRLTLDYDTRGGFSITGPYEVESGKYDFSFQNLASLRKFDIERGSRIEWSGDPYSAQLNMKTGYIANLAINTIDPSITTSTRYPAQVIVNLTDDLMHPKIAFGLSFLEAQLPIDDRPKVLAFQERLRNDEQLLSRNVSSILAFNQILFGNNESNANLLNQQFLLDNISNLVSNQIGNIASQIDPNLELGLQLGDIRQNFNNTQLNVAYQYNDRLRLKGNSFYSNGSLENITNNQTQLTLGGEFEYLLSNDGTWLLRAYGRSVPTSLYISDNSVTAATGNILVSGVSVQFSRNFNYIFPKKNAIPKGISTSEIKADAKKEDEVSLK
ncbi:MAG: translocation/assembly module TamB, partial [Spirosomaceae bacterium]|nr:translocation/assembly module TamB [Spirosomataceae bacterium]